MDGSAAPSLFVYGQVSLLRPSGQVRRSTPLAKHEFTFGRLSSSDCRLIFETVSKLHARIVVEQTHPFDAALEVLGVNGLSHNGVNYDKGSIVPLNDNDEITICDRVFRWTGAMSIEIKVNSPPGSQRKAPRQSLIAAAQSITPAKPIAGASFFSGLLSPFKLPGSCAAATELDFVPSTAQSDLLTWDEQPNDDLDGPNADLISCDEIEVPQSHPELSQQAAGPSTPSRNPISPLTAQSQVNTAPPLSGGRVESRATPLPTHSRRTSLRMTIIPSARAEDWLQERELQRSGSPRRSTVQDVISSPTPGAFKSDISTPSSRRHSASGSPCMASPTSSTSRRVSALLLSPALSELNANADVGGDSDESSDSEDENEDDEPLEQSRTADSTDVLRIAVTVPLPDSPAPQAKAPVSPVQSRRPSMTRRLSLREKVLIRSAIQQANSPPDSPSKVTIPQPQLVDSESNATHHAEPTIASNTTASGQESIPQHPPSPRKASALQTLELETAASMCSAGDAQTESCHDEMSLITAQPTTPRSVPLPETPLGERAYLLQPATPGTAENKPMRTPTRPKFVSEMSSPVMHHRTMATPRSVLRSNVKGRSKGLHGFLQARPSTVKRKVVFNEDVYIQEIVDIRDKTLHWDPLVDGAESISESRVGQNDSSATPTRKASVQMVMPQASSPENMTLPLSASLPLFVSPAARTPQATATSEPPKAFTPVRASTGTPTSMRRAGRVVALGKSAFTGSNGTPGSSKRRAGRVEASQPNHPQQATASKATRLFTASHPPTPSAQAPKSVTRPASTTVLLRRMEALRRQSLPLSMTSPSTLPLAPNSPSPFVWPASTRPAFVANEVVTAVEDVGVAQVAEAASIPESVPQSQALVPIHDSTPTRMLPDEGRRSHVTPNLAAGIRRLFRSSPAQVTPRFVGLRDLFQVANAAPPKTPHMEGLCEMLEPPVSVEDGEAPLDPALISAEPMHCDTSKLDSASVELGAHAVDVDEGNLLATSKVEASFSAEIQSPDSPTRSVDPSRRSSPFRATDDQEIPNAASHADETTPDYLPLNTPSIAEVEVESKQSTGDHPVADTPETVSVEIDTKNVEPAHQADKALEEVVPASVGEIVAASASESSQAQAMNEGAHDDDATRTDSRASRQRKAVGPPVRAEQQVDSVKAPTLEIAPVKATRARRIAASRTVTASEVTALSASSRKKIPARKTRTAKSVAAEIVIHEDTASSEDEVEPASVRAPVSVMASVEPATTKIPTRATRGKRATAVATASAAPSNAPVNANGDDGEKALEVSSESTAKTNVATARRATSSRAATKKTTKATTSTVAVPSDNVENEAPIAPSRRATGTRKTGGLGISASSAAVVSVDEPEQDAPTLKPRVATVATGRTLRSRR